MRRRQRERMAAKRDAVKVQRPATTTVICTQCENPFERPVPGRATVCSRRCRNARDKARQSPEFLTAARRRYRQAHPEKFGWGDAKKAAYHRRRARKKTGSAGVRVVAAVIFDRDEWTCGLCGEPVDHAVAYPDPLSPSLDHVVPLSKGGTHAEANVQLAHLHCNIAKGARITA